MTNLMKSKLKKVKNKFEKISRNIISSDSFNWQQENIAHLSKTDKLMEIFTGYMKKRERKKERPRKEEKTDMTSR